MLRSVTVRQVDKSRGEFLAWSRFHRPHQRVVLAPRDGDELRATATAYGKVLPRGYGRSYGDSCLNDGYTLLDATALNRVLAFDTERGVVHCEAGVPIGTLQALGEPFGWRLAVTPSTRRVSVGGAIAHDVHGRNHPAAGSFGRYVRGIEVLRSDGAAIECGPEANTDLFRATVGGMGLTGLIINVEIQLRRARSLFVNTETRPFTSMPSFVDLFDPIASPHEYASAWVDLSRRGRFRGLAELANDAAPFCGVLPQGPVNSAKRAGGGLSRDFPRRLVSAATIRPFNSLYFQRGRWKLPTSIRFADFMYRRDARPGWNRLLGRNGFYQYHFVIPSASVYSGLPELIDRIQRSGNEPFRAIFKRYGLHESAGMMSFPIEGVGAAIDFVDNGSQTLALFEVLDDMVGEMGGRVYAAKDCALRPESWKLMYPQWVDFQEFVDPHFSSSLWRRVTGR
jgi:FAD/FMN-containing dehydrogenase